MAKVKIQGHASGTGILTVTAPNTSTDRTITLPDATGTLLNSDGDGSSLTGISSVGGATGADFNDNTKLRFGTGNDLEIYHDGSNSFIDDSGNGVLQIRSNDIYLQKYTGETMIRGVADGAAELYHNNVKKLETSAAGGTLTGTWTGAGKVLSYAAGQINMSTGIAHSGSTTKTATGVTFAIDSTVTNSNFIIHASGWTPHLNPTNGGGNVGAAHWLYRNCLLYTSPSPRDGLLSRMPSSA